MQYHARALVASGVEVDLVGFEGTALPRVILDDPRITVHRFTPSNRRYSQANAVAYAMVAVFDTLRVRLRSRRHSRAATSSVSNTATSAYVKPLACL